MPNSAAIFVPLAFFAFVAVVITLAVKSQRRRNRELLQASEQAGVEVVHASGVKNRMAAEQAFSRVGTLRKLPGGARNVRFAGSVHAGDREITIVEHSYTVSTGKSHHVVYNSIAAVDGPAAWPDLRLTSENFLHKIADMVGHKDIRVESEEFNKRWRVKGKDEEFATVLLTPKIQETLTAWPRGYWLAIGGGAIAVVMHGSLNAERLNAMIRMVTELADLIPPEMEMWGEGESPPQG